MPALAAAAKALAKVAAKLRRIRRLREMATVDYWQRQSNLALAAFSCMFVLIICIVLPFAVIFSFLLSDDSQGKRRGQSPVAEIPGVYWPIYEAAAERFEVNEFLLASVHYQESRFSGWTGEGSPPRPAQGVASGVNSYGCCAGPMQFNLSNTWEGHKNAWQLVGNAARPAEYPLDRRELPSCRPLEPSIEGCVYDDFDAITAAAHKLSKDGADDSLYSSGTRRAVCAYIGSCAVVDSCVGGPNDYCDVIPRARAWERMAADRDKLAWPVPSPYREPTSRYGVRVDPITGETAYHGGVDFAAPTGTPITAAAAGTVTHACRDVPPCSGYGNFVCVEHQPNLSTCYAHLARFGVGAGSRVDRGEVIGYAGSTGRSTGSHLHFEVHIGRYPAERVDPLPLLESGRARGGR